MILDPVSYLDCVVFCIALAIHLLRRVGLWKTLRHVVYGIPFLVTEIPNLFVNRVLYTLKLSGEPLDAFSRHATIFEVLAVRCAGYAHINLPPDVLQAFFHRNVVYPFLRFRMLRQLYLWSPVDWHEHEDRRFSPPVRGIWIRRDATRVHDIIIYFIHGGGFVTGSPHFYLEFLIAFHALLRQHFQNPAIFAIQYSLAPGAQYPTQRSEVLNGYAHVLSIAQSADCVCVMGDSAGGSLGLTLLRDANQASKVSSTVHAKPAFMVLISPWMTLVSNNHRISRDDYVSAKGLHRFAALYAPCEADPGVLESVSPSIVLRSKWKSLSPRLGYYIWYGANEVLADDIRLTIQRLRKVGAAVHVEKRQAGGRSLHVWPVIAFFLASDQERRLEEMKVIAAGIAAVMFNK